MALSSRTRSTRMLVITLVTVSLATITLDYRQGNSGPLAAAGRTALAVIAPLQDAVTTIFRPVGAFFSAVAHLPSLRSENDRLKQQLAATRVQLSTIESLRIRLQNLESLIGLKQTLKLETTGASVIANSVSNFEWSITIDKGSSDGIRVNMPVIADKGLVGRVVRVTSTSAKVELLIDPRSRVAARLVTSQETGLIHGRGPEDMAMDLIDPQTAVAVGEAVESAGYQGGLFPPGIPIGTVSAVSVSPGDVQKSILVRPAVDFTTLSTVLVVLSPGTR